MAFSEMLVALSACSVLCAS